MSDIKPNYFAVALDITEHCNFSDEDRGKVTGVYEIYVFDETERTHLCEATPSYALYYSYTSVHTANDVSDEDQERLYDLYSEPPQECVTYLHCRDVKRIMEIPGMSCPLGGPSEDDEDETIEDVAGDLASNQFL